MSLSPNTTLVISRWFGRDPNIPLIETPYCLEHWKAHGEHIHSTWDGKKKIQELGVPPALARQDCITCTPPPESID